MEGCELKKEYAVEVEKNRLETILLRSRGNSAHELRKRDLPIVEQG
jgi:hypothetical protein